MKVEGDLVTKLMIILPPKLLVFFVQLPRSIQNRRGRVQVKLHKTVFCVLEGGKGHFARLKIETSDSETSVRRTDRQTDPERTECTATYRTYGQTDRQTDRKTNEICIESVNCFLFDLFHYNCKLPRQVFFSCFRERASSI